MSDIFDIERLKAQKISEQKTKERINNDKKLAWENNKKLLIEYYNALSKLGVKPNLTHSRYGKMYYFGWNDGDGHSAGFLISSAGNCYRIHIDCLGIFKEHIKNAYKEGKIDERYSISWKSYKGIIEKNYLNYDWRICYIAEECEYTEDLADILQNCFAGHVKDLL